MFENFFFFFFFFFLFTIGPVVSLSNSGRFFFFFFLYNFALGWPETCKFGLVKELW